MSTRQSLLSILADGQFHSGTALGSQLGISRAAINKAVHGLIERGVEIHSVSGKGYRWAAPSGLLNAQSIKNTLDEMGAGSLPGVIVLEEVESTNSFLLDRMAKGQPDPEVCITEHQSGGRGRRGRQWLSTPYQNIAMSISWRYDTGPSRLSGLSVAAGVAIVRALQGFGLEGMELKWPNDVLHNGRKLAGILVDLRGEVDGPTTIVVGVGLNVRLHESLSNEIDQDWTDVNSISSKAVERNQLAAHLIRELYQVMGEFGAQGLRPYFEEWEKWHAFENRRVRIIHNSNEITGTVCGLDESGALKVDTGSDVIRVHSGEVSLRAG